MTAQLLNSDNYVFTIHAASSMLVGAATAILGAYVLIRERGSRIGMVFWLFTLCVSIWLIAFGAMYASLQETQALFWMRFATASVPAFTLVQRADEFHRFIRATVALSTIFCLGVAFTAGQARTDGGSTSAFRPLP
jgi:hypothetical protein